MEPEAEVEDRQDGGRPVSERGSMRGESYDKIEQMMADMIQDGEAGTLYDPVRRDLLLLIPGQSIMLYPNEQN